METAITVMQNQYTRMREDLDKISREVQELRNGATRREEQYNNLKELIEMQKETLEKHEEQDCKRHDEMLKIIESLQEKISDLQKKPAERWNDFTKTVITGIVSLVVGYIGAKLFGGAN